MVLEYKCLKCNRVQSSVTNLEKCVFCRNPLSHPKIVSSVEYHAPKGRPKSRGLGDTVAKVIKVVTGGLVKPCGGCEERRKKLNELVPYKVDEK